MLSPLTLLQMKVYLQNGYLLCLTSQPPLSGICQRGWSEVTLAPTYPTPSLTGQTFPNPGWHLPTNIRITPLIFPLPYYGHGHASVNCHTWTAFRYIAAVFWTAGGDGVDGWWQKSANLTKLDGQPDPRPDCNHSLHLRNCARFLLQLVMYKNIIFDQNLWNAFVLL